MNGDAVDDTAVNHLAELLWRDLQPYQQAACSSPRILVWCGTKSGIKEALYQRLNELASDIEPAAATVMNHLVTTQLLQSRYANNHLRHRGKITIQKIDAIAPEYLDWHPAEYFLYEYQVPSLAPLLRELPATCQTLSHYGFGQQTLMEAVSQLNVKGVDRVVPVGQALNFSEQWGRL